MGRHSKAVKLVGGVRGGLALLDDDERRRVIEAGERDIDDGVGFFRGTARPGTALMVAYVDEFRDRFRAGIGRGLMTSVMREPGIRGVRRGGTPVTARPVFCQVVIGQCGVSFPSEKAVGFSPVRNWPVIARVLLFHCIRA